MKTLRLLAHPKIAFFVVPFLMIVLVAGTIAQRFVGLYEAQKHFFFSFVVWLGPLPLPGTLSLLALLLASLLCKFIFFSPWQWRRAGVHPAATARPMRCRPGDPGSR